MHIFALDIGTSCVRAAVLDVATAEPVGPIARTEFIVDHPTPEAAQVPTDRLWDAVTAASRQASRGVESLQGVGLSVVPAALVLLDEKDQPAATIRMPDDHRARVAARQIQAEVGDEFLAEIGSRPLPGGASAVRFRQMLIDDPYLIREVRRYLHLNSWLALRMAGETAFDPANASLTGLYGTLTSRQWSPRWCDYFEVDAAWLPPVVAADTTVGTIRSAAAAELGIPAGLPLKLGTGDTSLIMHAAEMKAGDLLHLIGPTQLLAGLTDQPRADPRRIVYQLGAGDAFVHATYNPIGGAALDWIRSLCFRDQSEQEFHDRTITQALERSTRVTLDPPNLGGDQLEIEARRAAFRDLTLATDRLDLLVALLQEMRRQYQRALDALGLESRFRRVFLAGDHAEAIRRLLPEYAGAEVHVLDRDALHGVAYLFRP